ncbi:sodium/calcium exchanger 2-like isoform X3 [Mizuhopecten yessoensis]|uniref:Sodium/calcium exchanger 2 n=1 Tax=Mizuhopecten yessoensis TaxID=6573 RepID=A0A210QGV9_MIZYE|nr:sodium/calcium exchanger 2-like isoform X3 [Mizuhopecten yessoensis]OWF47929.1 Sodium/calcium exchanger 2 [Mizuhopecten yessoensis]
MATYNHLEYYSNGYVVEYVENGSLPCSSYILLPAENLWPKAFRGFLYILAIAYIFLGVAIASDIFMSSIEVITSKKKKVVSWDEEKQVKVEREVLVWNETVANLTLMALGSSAPEILLAVIETAKNLGNQEVEDSLGTFTIIGSAAFNLLIITSICIVSVPTPDVKNIREFGVFLLTAAWSLWAYVWMLLVVQYITPGVIDPWEAWVTLGYMPLFVIAAYCQDSGWWCKKKKVTSEEDPSDENVRIMTHQARKGSLTGHAIPGKELHVLEAEKQQRLSPEERHVNGEVCMTPESDSVNTSTNISVHFDNESHNDKGTAGADQGSVSERLNVEKSTKEPQAFARASIQKEDELSDHGSSESLLHDYIEKTSMAVRAQFRHAVVSAMTGNKKMRTGSGKASARFAEVVQTVQNINIKGKMPTGELFGKFTFASDRYAVLESTGTLDVDVLFHRNLPKPGSKPQIANGDAGAAKGGKVAPSSESEQTFTGDVTVEYETREGSAKAGKDFKYTQGFLTFKENEFTKSITIPVINDQQFESDVDFYIILKNPNNGSNIGDPSVTRVTIVDDDEPGEFLFEHPHCYADLKSGKVSCRVVREHGFDGKVTMEYSTIDGTAPGGKEIGANADYVHTEGILTFSHAETSKTIEINIKKDAKGSKNFIIAIKNPSLGAKIGQRSATVCHINKESVDDRIADVMNAEAEGEEEDISWGAQFVSALTIEGSTDEDGNEVNPSCVDYLLHFLTILWKVIGACVPPTKYLGAWPTFVLSLLYIGALTFLVEQLGHLIGCVVGLKTSVTGITIIALGTSLPDTFASRTAARQDEHADAAIGNVTGSNSVNVFLGLGLPWVLSTSYGLATGTEVKVPAGNLTQSVIIFTILGFLCIIVLILRRKFVGGELGGANPYVKWGTSILLLVFWCIYILLSSLKAYDVISL